MKKFSKITQSSTETVEIAVTVTVHNPNPKLATRITYLQHAVSWSTCNNAKMCFASTKEC